MPPRYVVQVQVAVLGAVPPLVAAALARDLARSVGVPRPHRRVAAAAAGCGLAVEGLYLWRTTTVNAEVQGLAFVALLALALARALSTGRRAWWGVALALAALLPFTHNLSAVIGGLVLATFLALAVLRTPRLSGPPPPSSSGSGPTRSATTRSRGSPRSAGSRTPRDSRSPGGSSSSRSPSG
ncbi:hypothetical protein ACFQPA_15515 [Halomarina halobia]|uniref:hypothetical protein n=1 Tax=Halomarina halobia TaxID=3033386 RepID=UPI0023E8F568|nr:hypothetical protein [Halomarina sp. PSR21]